MTYLRRILDNKGYIIKGISDRLDIPYRTLQRWLNYESIDQHIKFLRLLILLSVPIPELLKDIKQHKK